MSDDAYRIPVIEEDVRIAQRVADVERVTVRTVPETEDVVVHERLAREAIDLVRVPVDRIVAVPPEIRTEGEVTIIPVLEERLVVEKRLVLVEELHLRRRRDSEEVRIPARLRRTRVEVTREPLDPEERP